MSEHTPMLIMMSWGSKYKAQTGDQGLTAFQTLANDRFDRDCISRAVATWNAFHSPDGRTIATEDIGEGLFWQMRDALQDMTVRFEKCALAMGSDKEFVDIATEPHRALLSSLKIQEPENDDSR